MNSITKRIRHLLVRRPLNFSFIDDYVCGSSAPASQRQVDWLRERGINAIISLTSVPLRADWLGGMECRSIPVKDHAVPSIEQICQSVDFILQQEERKKRVLVHCDAGKGRTGTVLAAYLCRKYGYTPDHAIHLLRTKRSGSVERAQRKVVEEYWNQIPRASKNAGDRITSTTSEIRDATDPS